MKMLDQFGRERDMLEILIADALRTEPYPDEIKVIGVATGWVQKLNQAAAKRGVQLEITITELPQPEQED